MNAPRKIRNRRRRDPMNIDFPPLATAYQAKAVGPPEDHTLQVYFTAAFATPGTLKIEIDDGPQLDVSLWIPPNIAEFLTPDDTTGGLKVKVIFTNDDFNFGPNVNTVDSTLYLLPDA